MAADVGDGRGLPLHAALQRFPEHRRTIERLARTDETFLDICEELVVAERALETARSGPEELRKARGEEWQDLIERLVAEIATALRNETVIPMSAPARFEPR